MLSLTYGYLKTMTTNDVINQIVLFHVIDEEDASDAPVMATLFEAYVNDPDKSS